MTPLQAQAGAPRTHVWKAEALFKGIPGTMIIKNAKTGEQYVYNPKRSMERYTPESSFKVANALIGLEEKAVADEYEVKRWDGVVRQFDVWNRDHSLASAMRASAIWYYQAMARDIGSEKMQRDLDRIGYGNRDISGGIDTFWLNSSLEISAQEQIAFIEKLVKETLPFSEQNMKTVKRIMIDNDQDDYTIHGKTGTRLSDMGLGWYVGYVETKKNVWEFATNIDGSGSTARNITLEGLESLHIIDPPDAEPEK
ncbi:class D beta-lactamase [Paenibacillus sacheonensis]|uniref:Beta-lactamase n=2 Tax=Paenibacillus sacheonensis TaxID=742054 RepID=A0A7X4YRJ2_9BACL|nr:class D beta-lactamase [Paenibacillus sacheonensis]